MTTTAPFAEPLWHYRDSSPYYDNSHKRLRQFVREYVENDLMPHAEEWERVGQVPDEAVRKYVEKGFAIVKPTKREYMGGISMPAGIEPEKWDVFHTLVVNDELSRVGFSGILWGMNAGNGIGCPPIINFGNEEQRLKYLPGVSRGEIRFCLGITEPDAGSDVSGIKTIAKRVGNKYVVNGSKKWITNAIFADYCTAAVRTGGPGRGGISLLIIPLASKGVSRRRMYNSGVNASGSTFLEFDDVEVPIENLVGQENEAFKYIMSNFNPERLGMAAACIRLSRVCVEDAFNYAMSRETFGRPLIENQIIRAKFSKFGQLIEPCQAFLEQLAYTIQQNERHNTDVDVGGMTALLKVMSTRCLEKVCREAQQILGGAGYNKAGRGARIEAISRDVRVFVVGGGSEEILRDLAVRQELKFLSDIQRARI
ncbi:hypothetical protein LOZ58_004487 [Ophidiomyces ophidiicola]|nr:hypothetical protein LOZ65_000401 [Ophidiomyces ophidiicola]KAI1938630.1 hypothetical protein LOZ66_003433 [Ophidiomyces ophidiicola]KAI1959678.1 hypothetical protein LOZ58_004487 [Ophidiomyces ophidiicola]